MHFNLVAHWFVLDNQAEAIDPRILRVTHNMGVLESCWLNALSKRYLDSMSDRGWKILLVCIFALMCAWTLETVVYKSSQGKTAFVRWMAHTDRLLRHEMIYSRGDSNQPQEYPNLPTMALVLVPFHALGALPGSVAWWAFKCALVVVILAATWKMLAAGGVPPGYRTIVALLALSFNVFVLDLTHGNVNLLVGGLVAGGLVALMYKRDFTSGLAIGSAIVLKVTPVLFVLYLAWKRRWRALIGVAAGLLMVGWILPGLLIGFHYTAMLTLEWYQQMIQPFLTGDRVGLVQTSHINQSLTGLFHRLLTDSLAIEARPGTSWVAVKVNLLNLDKATVGLLLKGAYGVLVALIAWLARAPRREPRHPAHLGEFALVFLAMLLISERSWKHHYVLLILAHAFILRYLRDRKPTRVRLWLPAGLLGVSVVLHNVCTTTFLGGRWTYLAESYGVYVIGVIALFAACGVILRWEVGPSQEKHAGM